MAATPSLRTRCSPAARSAATICASFVSSAQPAVRPCKGTSPSAASPGSTREQLQFVEVFIRCRGKIKDVEEELGISYPTVVARLNDVVQTMGFEVRQEDADLSGRRQQILDELAAGGLTASEAATRLRAL